MPLRVYAEEGLLEIPFEALLAYHGHAALAMLALTYQGLRGALALLETDAQPVPRAELSVVSGHPGPGVRDACECVTRAVSRQRYRVDTGLAGARYGSGRMSYGFILSRPRQQVHALLRPGVLPPRFFELLGAQAPAAAREHAALRRQLAAQALLASPQSLFAYADPIVGGA